MHNILLCGAGQLGSRHLQALKKANYPLNIFVFDPNDQSLRLAEERYNQVSSEHKHNISYFSNLDEIKVENFIFAVIATNSDHRFGVLTEMLSRFKVSNILLEKILFNNESHYQQALNLITKHESSAWVNCCMRMQQVYKEIIPFFRNQRFTYTVSGSNYGLVTNAIHYIDHACSLAGNSNFKLIVENIDKKLVESKRKGFFELNGEIGFHFDNGSKGTIFCYEDGSQPVLIEMSTKNHRFIIRENQDTYWVSSIENKWEWEEKKLGLCFQSNLTNLVLNNLIEKKEIALPKLEESIEIHKNLLIPLRDFCKTNFEAIYNTNDFQFT